MKTDCFLPTYRARRVVSGLGGVQTVQKCENIGYIISSDHEKHGIFGYPLNTNPYHTSPLKTNHGASYKNKTTHIFGTCS